MLKKERKKEVESQEMESSSYIVDDKVKSSQTNGGKANEGNILAFLQKAKIELPCDLAIPLLSTDTKLPKKIQTFVDDYSYLK